MSKPLSRLKRGDKVAVIAPAGKVDKNRLKAGIKILESWGLEPEIGKNVFSKNIFFSSPDEKRLEDFQNALDNEEYKAIFYARGGYGTSRIIHNLKWDNFIKHPKWILGFSDATLILSKVQQLGYPCIHSPMPALFDKYSENDSLNNLKNLLFEGKYFFTLPKKNIETYTSKTEFQSIITGGNLSLIQTTIGTSFKVDFSNKILFIEDVDEFEYKVERMIFHLFHAGILDSISGIILGNLSFITSSKKFPSNIIETIKSLKLKNIEFILENFPSGHDQFNYPIVFGKNIKISLKHNIEIKISL